MTVSKLLAGTVILTLMLSIIPMDAYAGAPSNAVRIIFVVDESGSMATEHDFLNAAGVIQSVAIPLETALNNEGINDVGFGLVGFGAAVPTAHKILVGGGDFGTAAQFATAANGLLLNGGFEDGYDGIDEALSNFAFPAGAAIQIVLITDEDRDITGGSPHTFNTISTDLMSVMAGLNVIVDCTFTDGVNPTGDIIGLIKPTGDTFIVDGLGGFTSGMGGSVSSCFVTSEADYVDLAALNMGVAWNLNVLRAGGTDADSFTAAFVDVKVEEIMIQLPPTTVAGEIISIDSSALMLAGLSANAIWILPMLVGIAGTGAYFTRNIWNKTEE